MSAGARDRQPATARRHICSVSSAPQHAARRSESHRAGSRCRTAAGWQYHITESCCAYDRHDGFDIDGGHSSSLERCRQLTGVPAVVLSVPSRLLGSALPKAPAATTVDRMPFVPLTCRVSLAPAAAGVVVRLRASTAVPLTTAPAGEVGRHSVSQNLEGSPAASCHCASETAPLLVQNTLQSKQQPCIGLLGNETGHLQLPLPALFMLDWQLSQHCM